MVSFRRFFFGYILMLAAVFAVIFVISFRARERVCEPKILGFSIVNAEGNEESLYRIDVNITNEGDKGGDVYVSARSRSHGYIYDHHLVFLKPNENRSVTLFLKRTPETIEIEIEYVPPMHVSCLQIDGVSKEFPLIIDTNAFSKA